MKTIFNDGFDSIDVCWIDKGSLAEASFEFGDDSVVLELDVDELKKLQKCVNEMLKSK